MGNFIACALSSPKSGKRKVSSAAKVIFPTGEIRQFYQPTKVAELMLEVPNSFLVNSKFLQVGRRFSALNADEDLEMSNVYAMFPMKRVNSVVTSTDLGGALLFTTKVSSVGGRRRLLIAFGKKKILPAGERGSRSTDFDDVVEDKISVSELEFKQRMFMSVCRSKKPLLETILE